MRKPRRHIHVEDEGRSEPDGEGRNPRRSADDAPDDGVREHERQKAIDGRPIRHSRDVRLTEAVSLCSGQERCDVSDGIERRPEKGGANRGEVPTPARFIRAVEEREPEPFVTDGAAVVEIAVLVVEVGVTVEYGRS